MGIVNRTPDSFYDGGAYLERDDARARIDDLVALGVDWIDVGAESTRPGSQPVAAEEQLHRLGEVIPYAVSRGASVSVDTTSASVAAHACEQGAAMINSVSLEAAGSLGAIASTHGVDLVLNHCRGSMTDMPGFSVQRRNAYDDVVSEVAEEWNEAAQAARAAGLDDERLVFDPGLGFAKNASQSLELCAALAQLRRRVGDRRILVGIGRKSYLAKTVARQLGGEPPPATDRLGATIAAAIDCALAGADILRVHDVAAVRQALAYLEAVSVARKAWVPAGGADA